MGNTQQLRKEIIKMEKALELAEAKGEFDFELESKIQQAKVLLPEHNFNRITESQIRLLLALLKGGFMLPFFIAVFVKKNDRVFPQVQEKTSDKHM